MASRERRCVEAVKSTNRWWRSAKEGEELPELSRETRTADSRGGRLVRRRRNGPTSGSIPKLAFWAPFNAAIHALTALQTNVRLRRFLHAFCGPGDGYGCASGYSV